MSKDNAARPKLSSYLLDTTLGANRGPYLRQWRAVVERDFARFPPDSQLLPKVRQIDRLYLQEPAAREVDAASRGDLAQLDALAVAKAARAISGRNPTISPASSRS